MSCTRPAAVAALVAMLSGCGGGGTSDGASYQSLLSTYADLQARTPATATDPGALPTSGNARYEGAATYQIQTAVPQTDLVSAVTLDASFGAGQTVTGRLDNFFVKIGANAPAAMAGTVTLLPAGGGFPAGTNSFVVKPDGTISGGGLTIEFTEDIASGIVPGTMIGEFRGPDGQFLTGPIQFGGLVNGQTTLTLLNGQFYAERQP